MVMARALRENRKRHDCEIAYKVKYIVLGDLLSLKVIKEKNLSHKNVYKLKNKQNALFQISCEDYSC